MNSSLLRTKSYTAKEKDTQRSEKDFMWEKLRELNADHFKYTGGSDIYAFQQKERTIFLYFRTGDDHDTTSYEVLTMASTDLSFTGKKPQIVWSQEMKASLKELRPCNPDIEFQRLKEPLLIRLYNKFSNRNLAEDVRFDFSLTIRPYPQTAAQLDAFISLGLALLEFTDHPRLGKFPELKTAQTQATELLSGRTLESAKRIYRNRRWYAGLGSTFLLLSLCFGGFISYFGGLGSWVGSVSWLWEFNLTGEHAPFFFFLVSFILGAGFSLKAYQAYQLRHYVTHSQGYIDFDQINGSFFYRFLHWLHDLVEKLMILAVLGLVIWVFMKLFHHFWGLFQELMLTLR
ncbi:MAG: hypothetical protein D6B25_16745 [Desulfobulbaceae bacterium]|nr:MAG: hypothetical protein D6B25_16745 [Desulfobulbaceae bacterium]